MDHIYRGELFSDVAICGERTSRRLVHMYFWPLEYYKNGAWKRDYTLTYNWCEECLEGVPDLAVINNTEL